MKKILAILGLVFFTCFANAQWNQLNVNTNNNTLSTNNFSNTSIIVSNVNAETGNFTRVKTTQIQPDGGTLFILTTRMENAGAYFRSESGGNSFQIRLGDGLLTAPMYSNRGRTWTGISCGLPSDLDGMYFHSRSNYAGIIRLDGWGVGTTNPQARLHVNGSVLINTNLVVSNSFTIGNGASVTSINNTVNGDSNAIPTSYAVSNYFSNASWNPYIISYTNTNVVVNVTNGNLQAVQATNTILVTITTPDTNTTQMVRLDLIAGTNLITFDSSISNITTLVIKTNNTTAILFDKPWKQVYWKATQL